MAFAAAVIRKIAIGMMLQIEILIAFRFSASLKWANNLGSAEARQADA
jgi:hypothetical protein